MGIEGSGNSGPHSPKGVRIRGEGATGIRGTRRITND